MPKTTFEALRTRVGEEIGVSGWITLDQDEVDRFSELTDDWDHMHNDPDWASSSRWGGTIVHGLFTLALLPRFKREATDLPIVSNDPARGLAVNYGFDRVRFVSPLRVGQPARARIVLSGLDDRPNGDVMTRFRLTVEGEGSERPILIADQLVLFVFDEKGA